MLAFASGQVDEELFFWTYMVWFVLLDFNPKGKI